MTKQTKPCVGIIMGSDSDWPTLKAAAEICDEFLVPYEARIISAHRTPDDMSQYGKEAHTRGIKVIIAGAGGAAHLPGMIASYTPLPVIGVPIKTNTLQGMDSLLSIVQMPAGVPVATVAIGSGKNAGLLAMRILAGSDKRLHEQLNKYRADMANLSRDKDQQLNDAK